MRKFRAGYLLTLFLALAAGSWCDSADELARSVTICRDIYRGSAR